MKTCIRIILLLGILYSCNTKTESSAELKPESFPVAKVVQQDISIPLEYVTNLQACQNVEIRARVEGYLEKILVDEGQTVTKGQLLFQINSEEYRAELTRAEANVSSAEAEAKSALVELERVKLLVGKNVVAKTELDLAEARVDVAKSRIAQTKAEAAMAAIKVNNTNIRSPFDGVIDRIPFKIGSLINEGTLLTTISDASMIYAYFNISEFEYLNFYGDLLGDESFKSNIELIMADRSVYPLKGKIETMENEFESETGAIGIRASFKNPDGMIKHGSSGKVRMMEVKGSALLIPQKSTIEIQDKNYVYSVDKANMVMMKSFEPLRRYGDYYVVNKGLTADDVFVYEGIQNVREGMVITPVPVESPLVISVNFLAQN